MRPRRVVRAVCRILLVAALGLSVACQAAPAGTRPTRLILNGPAGGQQAPFMYARALGYYADEGLNVTIDEAHGSRDAAQRVARGERDFAFADPLAIWQTRAAGDPLHIVSTILQDSGDEVISLRRAPVTSVEALRGLSIGVTRGTAASVLLEEALGRQGLSPGSVDIVDLAPADRVVALRQGRVSAIVGRRDVHALQLQAQGEQITELPYRDMGVQLPGLSIAASDDLIAHDPQTVQHFVRASLRAWQAAREDPRPAGRAVVEQFLAGYEEEIVTQLRADLSLVCVPGTDRLGAPPPAPGLSAGLDLLTRRGLLRPPLSAQDAVTDAFMPTDAPACS
ncbi:MAG: ABC transporter substrate-binding protein [Chloroflexi bacterium]|nr:ABC transporter substrate-binding protein [Chloroflexota bacterium]